MTEGRPAALQPLRTGKPSQNKPVARNSTMPVVAALVCQAPGNAGPPARMRSVTRATTSTAARPAIARETARSSLLLVQGIRASRRALSNMRIGTAARTTPAAAATWTIRRRWSGRPPMSRHSARESRTPTTPAPRSRGSERSAASQRVPWSRSRCRRDCQAASTNPLSSPSRAPSPAILDQLWLMFMRTASL